jgi:hypothetical protein
MSDNNISILLFSQPFLKLPSGIEADLRPTILGEAQVCAIWREIGQGSRGIQCQILWRFASNFVYFPRFLAIYPPSSDHWNSFENAINTVLVLQPMSHHIKLQYAYRPENQIIVL